MILLIIGIGIFELFNNSRKSDLQNSESTTQKSETVSQNNTTTDSNSFNLTGTITKVEKESIIVDDSQSEWTVKLTNKTAVIQLSTTESNISSETKTVSNLKTGQQVTVELNTDNDGNFTANKITIVPKDFKPPEVLK